MGFSGLRRGLAGPLATLTGQFLFVRNPLVLFVCIDLETKLCQMVLLGSDQGWAVVDSDEQ